MLEVEDRDDILKRVIIGDELWFYELSKQKVEARRGRKSIKKIMLIVFS